MRVELSGLLAVLAALVLPLAVVSVWASTVVSDTDRYVRTVGPLADDPEVQDAVERRLESLVMDHLAERIRQLADRVEGDRLNAWLRQHADQLDAGVESVVRDAVRRAIVTVVESDAFRPAWEAANESAHTQLVAALEGDATRTDDEGRMTIALGTLLGAVLGVLADQGLQAADRVPDIDASFPVLDADQLDLARGGYRLVSAAGVGLPLAFVVLALGALLVTPVRRRAVGWLGLGALVAAGGVVGGWFLARTLVLDRLGRADREVAGAVWEVVTRSLVTAAVVLAAVGLLVLAGSWLAGRRSTRRAAA